MTLHGLFGPRRLGWRPVTPQGWALLWSGIVAIVLCLLALLKG